MMVEIKTVPNDPMLKATIAFWEAILSRDKFLMNPSAQTFVEHTIKYLKELEESKIPQGDKQ